MNYLSYRFKWHFNFLFSTPTHLDIELNNNCNQKCLSCWHSKPKELPFKIKKMSFENAKFLIDQAVVLKIKSVKFNLRGEPFIYKDLKDVLIYAKDRGLYTMVNTNGIALYDNFDIVRYIDELIISVDSFYHATYCQLHNCKMEDYHVLMFNLEVIQNMKKNGTIKTRLKINIHLNKFNVNEDFTDNIFKYRWYKFIIRDTMKRKGSDISNNVDKSRKEKCYHVPRRLTVLSNGDIYPCCVCYDNPDDIKIGGKYDIVTACFSLRRNNIRKNWNQYKTCRNCTSADNLKRNK